MKKWVLTGIGALLGAVLVEQVASALASKPPALVCPNTRGDDVVVCATAGPTLQSGRRIYSDCTDGLAGGVCLPTTSGPGYGCIFKLPTSQASEFRVDCTPKGSAADVAATLKGKTALEQAAPRPPDADGGDDALFDAYVAAHPELVKQQPQPAQQQPPAASGP